MPPDRLTFQLRVASIHPAWIIETGQPRTLRRLQTCFRTMESITPTIIPQIDPRSYLPLLCGAPSHIPDPKSWVKNSYSEKDRLEPLWWHGKMILLKGYHISIDGFPNVRDSVFLRSPLTNASRQAGAFRNPISILARINYDLSHLVVSLIVAFLITHPDSVHTSRSSR